MADSVLCGERGRVQGAGDRGQLCTLVWLPLFLIWRVDDGKGRQTNSKQIKSSVKSANTGAKMGVYKVGEDRGEGEWDRWGEGTGLSLGNAYKRTKIATN